MRRSRARSSSTSAVSTVSSVIACRLTSATWIARPASPNSAAANGMPTCTELPKVAEMARTLGAAVGSAPLRLARRSHR